jgi:hypothetical protein
MRIETIKIVEIKKNLINGRLYYVIGLGGKHNLH